MYAVSQVNFSIFFSPELSTHSRIQASGNIIIATVSASTQYFVYPYPFRIHNLQKTANCIFSLKFPSHAKANLLALLRNCKNRTLIKHAYVSFCSAFRFSCLRCCYFSFCRCVFKYSFNLIEYKYSLCHAHDEADRKQKATENGLIDFSFTFGLDEELNVAEWNGLTFVGSGSEI